MKYLFQVGWSQHGAQPFAGGPPLAAILDRPVTTRGALFFPLTDRGGDLPPKDAKFIGFTRDNDIAKFDTLEWGPGVEWCAGVPHPANTILQLPEKTAPLQIAGLVVGRVFMHDGRFRCANIREVNVDLGQLPPLAEIRSRAKARRVEALTRALVRIRSWEPLPLHAITCDDSLLHAAGFKDADQFREWWGQNFLPEVLWAWVLRYTVAANSFVDADSARS